MKKLIAAFICMMIFLTGCEGDSGKSTNSVQAESKSMETSMNNESQMEGMEAESQESNNVAAVDPGELIEIPFGYVTDSGYKEYFTFKIPGTTTFVGGTTKDNMPAEAEGGTCKDFEPFAGNAQLIAASFVDNVLFGGAIFVDGTTYLGSFEESAEAFLEGTNDSTEFQFTRDSGETNGIKWYEAYGINSSGTYDYYLLFDMGDQIEFYVTLYGAKGTLTYDQVSMHDYFINAISKMN